MKKKLISLFFIISVLIVVLLPFSVSAASSGTCGNNLTWALDDSGVLTISGTGDMRNFSFSGTPWYTLKENITDVKILNGVTSIGTYAFRDCTNLQSVSISDSVSTIHHSAFRDCSSLQSITLPSSITFIGDSAFWGCYSLQNVYISDISAYLNIDFGGYGAVPVYYADNLYINNELVTDLVIPDGIEKISSYAFYGYKNLKTIIIPNSVTTIEKAAFYVCTNLQSITLPFIGSSRNSTEHFSYIFDEFSLNVPSSLKTVVITDEKIIHNYAFEDCTSIQSITILDGVESICNYAFSGCSGLETFIIPNSVTTVEKAAFHACTNLQSITLPFIGSSRTSSDHFFYFFGDSEEAIPASLKVVTITDMESIPKKAFYRCSNLQSINLPDSVTSIGSSAFFNCKSLQSFTIPNGVTYIEEGTFENCTNLQSITIPDSVTYVANYAFYKCSSLTVNYIGTHSQWKKITIDSNNTALIDAKINYIYITITFDSANNSAVTTQTILAGEKASKPDDPIKHGYYLEGWYREPDYINKFDFSSAVTSDITLYAKWSVLTSGFCGEGLLWNISNGTLTISGAGDMDNFSYSSEAPWFLSRKSIKTIEISSSVTSIGYEAFYGCSSLQSISIPGSVVFIGNGAFWDCSSLRSITIPDGVTFIGSSAFYRCSSLQSITIPNNVTSIGDDAFRGCSSLQSITIPDGVTSIGNDAFCGCSSLQSISIPDSVTSIDDSAFDYCSKLQSITIGGSVTSISEYAFRGCSSLQSITIPGSVTSIGDDAFYGCSSLQSITIPGSVTSIGSYAFYRCSSLQSITIPNSVASIGDDAFCGCSSLQSITIPSGVMSIGDRTFRGCSNLQSITIPDSVTSIDEYTFYGCSSLQSITITKNVTSIKADAFSGCTSLTTINYEGSEDDFLNIYIEPGNKPFENATVNYSVQVPQEILTASTCINNKITVVPYNVERGSYIVAACYNGKKLVQFFPCNYNGESELYFYPDVEFDTIKVMVWKSAASLAPLCGFEPVPVQ